tara:strand:+ start:16537 stop:17283 length:747 start_codon:yes stop_codon:yes gene_type:complete
MSHQIQTAADPCASNPLIYSAYVDYLIRISEMARTKMDYPVTVRVSKSTAAIPFSTGSKIVWLAWCLGPSSPRPRFFDSFTEVKKAASILKNNQTKIKKTREIIKSLSFYNRELIHVEKISHLIDIVKIIDGENIYFFIRMNRRIVSAPFQNARDCRAFAIELLNYRPSHSKKLRNGVKLVKLNSPNSEMFCVQSNGLFSSSPITLKHKAEEYALTIRVMDAEEFEKKEESFLSKTDTVDYVPSTPGS